jgi:hypothetical protein
MHLISFAEGLPPPAGKLSQLRQNIAKNSLSIGKKALNKFNTTVKNFPIEQPVIKFILNIYP